jgi:small-conductance mechanosensitive channel
MPESEDKPAAVVYVFLLLFLLFVFQCIALTHSDTDAFYAACGHQLRDLMLGSLILSTAGIIIFIVIYSVLMYISLKVGTRAAFCLFLLYVLVEIFLSGFILGRAADALGNQACKDAMQSVDGGINSISANIGSPLLAIVGIVSSAFTFGVILFFICLTALDTAFYNDVKSILSLLM